MLALAGAVLIGLSLGLLGSGGSILTVPVLVYLVGQPEKVAIADSLAIVGCVSFAAFVPHALRGDVAWRSAMAFGAGGMGGTVVGASMSRWFSGTAQLLMFAVVMLVAAVVMVRGQRAQVGGATAPGVAGGTRPTWRTTLDGLAVGVVTGLVGVGGGFLIVPALVLLGGQPMRVAVGTSLLIIALNSTTGFLRYLSVLEDAGFVVDWSVIATFSSVGAAGTVVGNLLGRKVPQAMLRRIFGVFLVVMAAFILWREL